jgi:hypothetical protein
VPMLVERNAERRLRLLTYEFLGFLVECRALVRAASTAVILLSSNLHLRGDVKSHPHRACTDPSEGIWNGVERHSNT